MRKILTVSKHEFLTNLRRPSFIIATLIVPALGGLALLVAAFAGGRFVTFFEQYFKREPGKVGYIDEVGLFSPTLEEYADAFIPYPDEGAAREALLAGEIEAYLVIPEDYLETGRVLGYTKERGLPTAIRMEEEKLQPFFVHHLLAGRVDPKLVERVAKPLELDLVTLGEEGEVGWGPFGFFAGFIVPYIFSILLVMAIFSSSGLLLQGVSEEKESRVIEILLSSVSPFQLLTGKILGLGALGLAQVLFWLTCGWGLMGGAAAIFAAVAFIIDPLTVALGLVYFLLGYILFATMMAAAGSLGTSMREGQQIVGIFLMMASIPLMLSGFLWANPNSILAMALSYFPPTAPTMMLLRLGVGEVPLGEIAISLTLLVVGIGVVLWAGTKVFRMSLLMYGKRPTVREITRALRRA
jgi:ABC-2 type transport system permease protein